MALKEMYKNEIEPHNLFCVDNSRILIHTHTHICIHIYNYVFTIGQWKTWYFGGGHQTSSDLCIIYGESKITF